MSIPQREQFARLWLAVQGVVRSEPTDTIRDASGVWRVCNYCRFPSAGSDHRTHHRANCPWADLKDAYDEINEATMDAKEESK